MSSLGLLARALACFALVFATWNPTGYSYLAALDGTAPMAAKVVGGAILIVGYTLFLRIAWLSLGLAGSALAFTLLSCGVLTLWEFDLLDLSNAAIRPYIILTIYSLYLTIGLVWSVFKRRVTGQSNSFTPP